MQDVNTRILVQMAPSLSKLKTRKVLAVAFMNHIVAVSVSSRGLPADSKEFDIMIEVAQYASEDEGTVKTWVEEYDRNASASSMKWIWRIRINIRFLTS